MAINLAKSAVNPRQGEEQSRSIVEVSKDVKNNALVMLSGKAVQATSAYYIKIKDPSNDNHKRVLEWLRKSLYSILQDVNSIKFST
ncbi:hypothetical protein [Xenorhabdus sp. TH1]|uniref:hypothetical protein n=1 Tax=Xenorhabdus sp. TH1 TaxID=3130166 RepID=UPI0030D3DF51